MLVKPCIFFYQNSFNKFNNKQNYNASLNLSRLNCIVILGPGLFLNARNDVFLNDHCVKLNLWYALNSFLDTDMHYEFEYCTCKYRLSHDMLGLCS